MRYSHATRRPLAAALVIAAGALLAACQGAGNEPVYRADGSTLPAPAVGLAEGEADGDVALRSDGAGISSRDLKGLPEADPMPAGMEDAVALSFDDGVDGFGNTDTVLDVLKQRGITATFFINSDNVANGAPLVSNPKAQAALLRVFAEGHAVGNHTAHHYDLSKLDSDAIAYEVDHTEEVVRQVTGMDSLRLTMLRAPYGRPLSPWTQKSSPDTYAKVAQIFARRGVHIAWDIDPNDWQEKTSQQVIDDTMQQIDSGKRGIILLHAIQPRTGKALPGLIDAIAARGLRLVTVQDIFRAKYNTTPDALFGANGATAAP